MTIPLFLIPIVSGLIAQGLKPIFNRAWYKDMSLSARKLPRYGGMPSAHTSFAVSLLMVVGWVDGIASVTFSMAASILIFILDDALRMRIFVGRYGQAILRLVQDLPEEDRKKLPRLEKRLGHTGPEVVAGGFVGLVSAAILLYYIVG